MDGNRPFAVAAILSRRRTIRRCSGFRAAFRTFFLLNRALQEAAIAMPISISSTLLLLRRTLLIAFLLLFAYPLFAKSKDDVVVMKNGDKFTGEIKNLQYGELVFKSSYMKDSVHLDWKEVESLQSKDTFIVSLSDGQRVTGSISREGTPADNDKDFKIIDIGTAVDVTPSDVIAIGQREGNFWNQLTGSIDYGFGFASGNNSTNSSLGADIAFRTATNTVKLATNSQFESQTNAQNTNRFTFDSPYGRMLTKN